MDRRNHRILICAFAMLLGGAASADPIAPPAPAAAPTAPVDADITLKASEFQALIDAAVAQTIARPVQAKFKAQFDRAQPPVDQQDRGSK